MASCKTRHALLTHESAPDRWFDHACAEALRAGHDVLQPSGGLSPSAFPQSELSPPSKLLISVKRKVRQSGTFALFASHKTTLCYVRRESHCGTRTSPMGLSFLARRVAVRNRRGRRLISRASSTVRRIPVSQSTAPHVARCWTPLRTVGDTNFYRCPRDGVLMLPPDGRIRQPPQ